MLTHHYTSFLFNKGFNFYLKRYGQVICFIVGLRCYRPVSDLNPFSTGLPQLLNTSQTRSLPVYNTHVTGLLTYNYIRRFMILDSHTGLTFAFMREKDCYRLVTYFIKCVSVYNRLVALLGDPYRPVTILE